RDGGEKSGGQGQLHRLPRTRDAPPEPEGGRTAVERAQAGFPRAIFAGESAGAGPVGEGPGEGRVVRRPVALAEVFARLFYAAESGPHEPRKRSARSTGGRRTGLLPGCHHQGDQSPAPWFCRVVSGQRSLLFVNT